MTPGDFPLVLYRGDSYRWRFTLWANAAKTDPVDLTNVTVKSEIRAAPSSALLATLTTTVELPNVIAAELSPTACATLPASAAWDLQLTYPDGTVATVLAGAVAVTPDVTDSSVAASSMTGDLAARAARVRRA